MSKCSKTFVPFLLCLFLPVLVHAQENEPTKDIQGSLVGGNKYVNAALGMTITLPGIWELGTAVPTHSTPPSDCSGPLCGNPEINAMLKIDSPAARIHLIGYKMSAQYLNRSRYPLSKFADIMLEGSMRNGSDLVAIGSRSAVKLDGKSAYRQAAGIQGETVPKIVGYVSEANGYVFMLVEVGTEICVYDFSMAGVDQLMDVSYRIQCAAVSPIGVLLWR